MSASQRGSAPAPLVSSFAPAFRADARALVLGSMPGEASLAAAQYYAHPRNAFWPIMDALFGAGPQLPYAARLARLNAAGIALWDVIARCERSGSLDSAITPASIEPNDFVALFAACPQIRHVFFNGGAAEAAFRRHVRLPAGLTESLPGGQRRLRLVRLPSTSPAHAARSFEAKLAAWQVVREALDGRGAGAALADAA